MLNVVALAAASLVLFSLVATFIAYLYPRLRCVEHELPDAIPDEPEVS